MRSLLPIAGELQGALADGDAEGLVGGDGVEPFGLRLVVGSQEVNQTQGLTSGGPASEKLGAEGTRNLRLRFELETMRPFNSTSNLGFLCYAPSLKQAGPPAVLDFALDLCPNEVRLGRSTGSLRGC